MKINPINNINYKGHQSILKSVKRAAGEKFAQIDQIGEGTNIMLDFLGKAVVVPTTIMLVSKEDKEKKKYSALKNPVAAVMQLSMEAPILMLGSKFVEKLANENKLYKKGSRISYNERAAKEEFISIFNAACLDNPTMKKNGAELIEKLNKKGLSKSLKEELQELINNYGKNFKKPLNQALVNFDKTHKNLYHLQNRVCFAAAIILTPLLCKAEDYFFPKVMSLLGKKSQNSQKTQKRTFLSLHHFKTQATKGGLK